MIFKKNLNNQSSFCRGLIYVKSVTYNTKSYTFSNIIIIVTKSYTIGRTFIYVFPLFFNSFAKTVRYSEITYGLEAVPSPLVNPLSVVTLITGRICKKSTKPSSYKEPSAIAQLLTLLLHTSDGVIVQ